MIMLYLCSPENLNSALKKQQHLFKQYILNIFFSPSLQFFIFCSLYLLQAFWRSFKLDAFAPILVQSSYLIIPHLEECFVY